MVSRSRQMFNAREGAIRQEISQRVIGSPPMEKGPVKNISLDLETMAQGYYHGMGFAKNGIPLQETLKELSLAFCLKDISNCTGVPEPLENKYLKEQNKHPYHPKLKY
jgi:aldehyde:ferredoxin oxidoreductase